MKVVTVISDENNKGYTKFLSPSIKANGLAMKVLKKNSYKNHLDKNILLSEYLEKLDSQEIVFFTDGYDTVFLANEKEILEKYRSFNKRLVFAAEMVCWPDSDLSKKYPKADSIYKFLNSGGFIGEAGYIRHLLNENFYTESTIRYPWSNQIYWAEQYLKNQDSIALDSKCQIFCTMASMDDLEIGKRFLDRINKLDILSRSEFYKNITDFHFDIESDRKEIQIEDYLLSKKKWFKRNFNVKNNRLFIYGTHSYPCHIHFNGESKVLIQTFQEMINSKDEVTPASY